MTKKKNIFTRLKRNKFCRRVSYFVDAETGVEYVAFCNWCTVRVNADGTPKINKEWKKEQNEQ